MSKTAANQRLLSSADHKNTPLDRDPMGATTGWGKRDAESYSFSKYKAQDKHSACKSIYSVSAEGWLGERNAYKGSFVGIGGGAMMKTRLRSTATVYQSPLSLTQMY